MIAALAARQRVEQPVLLLAAHPDDETIGAGGVLPLFRDLVLVHLTDGAPRDGRDARAHGFASAEEYAAARHRELGHALRTACVAPARVALGAPDQGATARLADLAACVRGLVARHGIAALLTHPYEGGHPDHDAAAWVAAQAGVPVFEFSSYHADGAGGMAVGCFLPGPEQVTVALTPAEAARKRAMLDCFATQAATLAPFGVAAEPFRPAPRYDFTAPPHPGTLHYERFDWGMTGARWRAAARAAC